VDEFDVGYLEGVRFGLNEKKWIRGHNWSRTFQVACQIERRKWWKINRQQNANSPVDQATVTNKKIMITHLE
jgi:hypothetical protein